MVHDNCRLDGKGSLILHYVIPEEQSDYINPRSSYPRFNASIISLLTPFLYNNVIADGSQIITCPFCRLQCSCCQVCVVYLNGFKPEEYVWHRTDEWFLRSLYPCWIFPSRFQLLSDLSGMISMLPTSAHSSLITRCYRQQVTKIIWERTHHESSWLNCMATKFQKFPAPRFCIVHLHALICWTKPLSGTFGNWSSLTEHSQSIG